MNNDYKIYMISKEKQHIAEKAAMQYSLIREATRGATRHPGTQLLVKLGSLLIQTGQTIKSHAERDLHNYSPVVTVQDMKFS